MVRVNPRRLVAVLALVVLATAFALGFAYHTHVNGGKATISSGQTRVTVQHGLVSAPSKVLVTPLGQPPGKVWVENITSTSFDIVTDTAPSSNLSIAWYAEV